MAVDLLGRPIGDSPKVRTVSTGSTAAFGQVRRNGGILQIPLGKDLRSLHELAERIT